MSVLSKIMRAGEGKILRKLHRIADQVNSIEEDFVDLSDAELRALTDEYKQRYTDGESLDDLLPEAFATVREAAKRVLGQRHYDVQIEAQNFETRKNVLKYDEVMNRQREVIYGERRRVLEGEDLHEQIQHFMDDTIDAYVQAETAEGFPEDWDLDRLWGAFKQLYPVSVTVEQLEEEAGDRAGLTAEFISEAIKEDIRAQYEAREAQLGSEIMRELERRVVLSVLDRKWREHLYEMDYLQEGIGLRAMAQKDPLVEYQREGFDMFQAMMDGIKEESVGYLFNLEVQVEQQVEEVPVEEVKPVADLEKQDTVPAQAGARPEIRAKGLDAPQRRNLHFSAPTVDGEGGTVEGDFATDEEPVRSEADGLTRAERRKQAKGGRRRKK
ncbi:Protein translocase subunit SecA [Streptomyces griseomycini]